MRKKKKKKHPRSLQWRQQLGRHTPQAGCGERPLCLAGRLAEVRPAPPTPLTLGSADSFSGLHTGSSCFPGSPILSQSSCQLVEQPNDQGKTDPYLLPCPSTKSHTCGAELGWAPLMGFLEVRTASH